jgi:predicted GNAT superfamily acetyltransferase
MSDPWGLAHDAAASAGVRLAPLHSVDECDLIHEVEVATWGDAQLVPREMLRAFAESGNVPWGAFEGSSLVGFVLGWAGVDGDGLHVHSHMLAVLPRRRHGGVGYALKLAQRALALEQGIALVRWTFDPLVARNAYFNLQKLGAVVDRFERDFYGEMHDELNRGDRSDRGVVGWDLEPDPGRTAPAASPDAIVVLDRRGDRPGDVAPAAGDVALVEVPQDLAEVRQRDAAAAQAWRDAVAGAFEACLAAGLVATAFDRERSAYVFTRTAR